MTDPELRPPIPPLEGLDSEELCRLLDVSTEGTWVFEPDTDRVCWSPKLFEFLVYDAQYEGLADIMEITHPEDRIQHAAAVERVLEHGGQYRAEVRILGGDGRYRWCGARGVLLPARGEVPRRLVGFVIDIKEQQAVKEEFEKSEARFRSFMNNCPAAVFIKRADGVHLYANEVAARMAGLTVEEMVGRSTAEIFSEEVADRLMKADREALSAGSPTVSTHALNKREGQDQYVMDVKFPVTGFAGESLLIGGFGLDISDRVRQERELRLMDRRMQERQRLESLGLLAGGVAHDFNNILLTMMGNAELALSEPEEKGRSRYLTQLMDRCRYASALCSQLLNYAGRGHNQPKNMDPEAFLRGAGELLSLSRGLGVEIESEVEAGLPAVFIDEVQMRQVLLNLVTNGAQATGGGPDGKVRLECFACAQPAQLDLVHSWVEERPEDLGFVTFAVEDNGSGMVPEDVARIFEPFFTTKKEGHGLGLSAALGIIRSHHGVVSVRSEPGVGTRVEVSVPAVKSESVAPNAPVSGQLDLDGKRVLLVDDQAEVLQVAASLLESLGIQVESRNSGPEALEFLQGVVSTGALDAAVVDVTMPGMTGIEVAERMHELLPGLPVILTSGYVADGLEVIGDHGFLQKPYSLRALRDALHTALGA